MICLAIQKSGVPPINPPRNDIIKQNLRRHKAAQIRIKGVPPDFPILYLFQFEFVTQRRTFESYFLASKYASTWAMPTPVIQMWYVPVVRSCPALNWLRFVDKLKMY